MPRSLKKGAFVDEHLLPRREVEALSFLAAWKRSLAERDVGALGIGCMLRSVLMISIGALPKSATTRSSSGSIMVCRCGWRAPYPP